MGNPPHRVPNVEVDKQEAEKKMALTQHLKIIWENIKKRKQM
jgi:hypothetical protein